MNVTNVARLGVVSSGKPSRTTKETARHRFPAHSNIDVWLFVQLDVWLFVYSFSRRVVVCI